MRLDARQQFRAVAKAIPTPSCRWGIGPASAGERHEHRAPSHMPALCRGIFCGWSGLHWLSLSMPHHVSKNAATSLPLGRPIHKDNNGEILSVCTGPRGVVRTDRSLRQRGPTPWKAKACSMAPRIFRPRPRNRFGLAPEWHRLSLIARPSIC